LLRLLAERLLNAWNGNLIFEINNSRLVLDTNNCSMRLSVVPRDLVRKILWKRPRNCVRAMLIRLQKPSQLDPMPLILMKMVRNFCLY
jgi:hypothetical protein